MTDGRSRLLNNRFLDHAIAVLSLWYECDSRTHKIIPFHPGGDNRIAYAAEKALELSSLDAQIRADFTAFADGASGLHWLAYDAIIAQARRFDELISPVNSPERGYEVLPAARALLKRIPGATARYGPFVKTLVTETLAAGRKETFINPSFLQSLSTS